jgi:hypothetical protein
LGNPLKYTDPSGHCVEPGTPCLVADGSSPETDDLLQYLLSLLNQRDAGEITDLVLTQMLLEKAYSLFSHPLDALRAATEVTRGGISVPGSWGFEFATSAYFYQFFTPQLLGDSGFGDLRDGGDQVSHFIGEAYISLWARIATRGLVGGTAFVFGQEARNPGQVPHQSHIDVDLGMIANGMAGALYGGADPALATSKAMALIVAYNYSAAHPRGSWSIFQGIYDYYRSPEWLLRRPSPGLQTLAVPQ